MNTREIIEMSSAHLMRNYGRLPLALVRGAGSWVWDADGSDSMDSYDGLYYTQFEKLWDFAMELGNGGEK